MRQAFCAIGFILSFLLGIGCATPPATTPDDDDPSPPAPAALGLTGAVHDNAGDIVVGATVYLVRASDIPREPILATDIVAERESTIDEPLEDTIATYGTGYPQAVTDIGGYYRIDSVPAGSYFVTVIPAPSDDHHLPGGSLCRKALQDVEIAGKTIDIKISTTPSPKAQYVGPSVCFGCHGITHQIETLHMNGIRKIGKTSPLQNPTRFPTWNDPLNKFTAAGTTLYFYAFNGDRNAPDWKVSETPPASGVSFTARLYTSGGTFFVDLTDVKGTTGKVTYPVEMTYGGGLYKQHYMVVINGSRFVLPFGYQTEGQTDETQLPIHWVWVQNDAQNWYDEAKPGLRTPATKQSFDSDCAGCHFTGYSLTGDATTGFRAHAVNDPQGEMDFDGDGKLDELNVSCESCHGPGSEHWQHAGAGTSIVSPQLLTPEREVVICAACHTRPVGVGAGGTKAPLDASGLMIRPGGSRNQFLTSFVSKLDDQLWDTAAGDGKHSKGNYQQATDFIKSSKYRNETQLVSCASCHDPHGNNVGLKHGLIAPLDDASTGKGICLSCHDAEIPADPNLEERIRMHYSSKGIIAVPKAGVGCADCHSTKTARSGAGRRQRTIEGVTYYGGDITSHLFDVPLRSDIAIKGPEMMPIPYTGACGYCHIAAP